MSTRKGRGQILNRTDMADHLGVAMPTLDDWVRRGCPVVERGGRGRAWQFNSADVRAWRDEDIRNQTAATAANVTIDDLKRRKLEAETLHLELELAKARGEVVPVEQYERALGKAFGEVRAGLRNVVPGRAARRLLGESDETRFKAVLLEEVDQALEALADADLIFEDDLEDEEEGKDDAA